MKKVLLLLIAALTLFCSSCSSVTILNSDEAKEHMEALGYSVDISVDSNNITESLNLRQYVNFIAKKDDDFIQVYYFTCEEDTDTFYKRYINTIAKKVDIIKKNKYSIYRGTVQAVEDFLV